MPYIVVSGGSEGEKIKKVAAYHHVLFRPSEAR